MKPCINCQKNEAEYCSSCIDQSDKHLIIKDKKSTLLAFCVSCETIIGGKNADNHLEHHIILKRVQA